MIRPDLKTPEGWSFCDSLEQTANLYVSSYTQDQAVWLFGKGNTVLAVLPQDG